MEAGWNMRICAVVLASVVAVSLTQGHWIVKIFRNIVVACLHSSYMLDFKMIVIS